MAVFASTILGIAASDVHPDASASAAGAGTSTASPRVFELAQASQAHFERARQMQRALKRRGYDPGPIDGLMGRRTANAIRAFQADHGLAVTGMASRTVYEMLVPPGEEQ